jgi:hypothetical protein
MFFPSSSKSIEMGRPEEVCNVIGWLFVRKWPVVVATRTVIDEELLLRS